MALPIIPHEFFGVDCCGCLVEIVDVDRQFRCNECDALIPVEDVQRAVMEIESTEAICPHCGEVNHISGFASVDAFICAHCSRGVGDS
jgi:Zn finger protein HypA/HybF involved in hydrogenase expression